MDNDLKPVKISSFRGKVVILSTVTSLDTSVCDTETRRFNQEAANLGDDVVVLTVSMDLPFAQKRWCGAAGIDRVKTLSDYRDGNLGKAYGTLFKDLHLHARAIHIIDRQGKIQYKQFVPENSQEPNYDDVIKAAKNVLKK
jgi:thiol peroxidase